MENGDLAKPQLPNAELDWEELRAQSIRPHGFGEERVRLWPKLLHVEDEVLSDQPPSAEPTDAPSATKPDEGAHNGDHAQGEQPHADERQIGLDTDRSFVLYPVEDSSNREKLQAGLNRLIVSVFRRRPRLHYFQGYHDIVSVLFLTLPEHMRLPVTEKMSLHRVRDSMGTTLEPVVGLLRILKRLLHLADEKLSESLERAAPLPYFALSNLLTLFSHDVPTLPLIQHIFDYLLCRPPIAVVYLAAALTLMRREEIRALEDEGEEGMMHSLLTGLPELYEEGDETIPREETPAPEASADNHTEQLKDEEQGAVINADEEHDADAHAPSTPDLTSGEPQGSTNDAVEVPPAPSTEELTQGHPARDEPDAQPHGPQADPDEATEGDVQPPVPTTKAETEDDPPREYKPPSSEQPLSEKPPTRTASPEPTEPSRPHRPRISLTALLSRADELYATYPPSHPSIAVSSIMGPQSVMLTWSERRSELPDDDDAELMVTKPELIVLPHIEPDDDVASDGDSFRKGPGEREKERRRRRKLRKHRPPRRLTDIVVQRKTMVAGAVLVLGVAMAVYGFNAGLPGAGGGHHRGGYGREWKKMGKYLGGALVGVGERVFDGLRRGLE